MTCFYYNIDNDVDIYNYADDNTVTHVGCECGSVSHVSQNKTQFMYNVYYKLNDAIHTNNVQLFTHTHILYSYLHTVQCEKTI